jgi:hypothetical protein
MHRHIVTVFLVLQADFRYAHAGWAKADLARLAYPNPAFIVEEVFLSAAVALIVVHSEYIHLGENRRMTLRALLHLQVRLLGSKVARSSSIPEDGGNIEGRIRA